jgi:hypothetical protein
VLVRLHNVGVEDALFRASLQIASYAELMDPDGQLWTVHITRSGDPRDPFVRATSAFFPALLLNRLRRLIQRDHTWNVELMPGQLRDDRRTSVIRSTDADKDAAIETAVQLARQVKAGAV